MTDIFISYSRNDQEWASKLATALEARGYRVWWDISGLLAGNDFQQTIPAVLDVTSCVIVVWSSNSVISRWVRSEATRGDERRVLVPLRIDNAIIPLPFNILHTEDLRGWDGSLSHAGFQKLLQAIAQHTQPSLLIEAQQKQVEEETKLKAAGEEAKRNKVGEEAKDLDYKQKKYNILLYAVAFVSILLVLAVYLNSRTNSVSQKSVSLNGDAKSNSNTLKLNSGGLYDEQIFTPKESYSKSRTLNSNEESEADLLRAAREAYWSNKLNRSAELYQQLLNKEPESSEYKGELANVYWKQGNSDEAAKLFAEIAPKLAKQGRETEVFNMLLYIDMVNPELAKVLRNKMELPENESSQEGKLYALTVNATPQDARVRIMNIIQTYEPGIKLSPGDYDVEVDKPGFLTKSINVSIVDLDKEISVSLAKDRSGK